MNLLDESFNKLMPERSKLVRKLNRKTHSFHGSVEIVIVKDKEVDVRRESAKEIQDVMSTVVSYYSFALYRRTQLELFSSRVQHFVRQDFQLMCCFAQLNEPIFIYLFKG